MTIQREAIEQEEVLEFIRSEVNTLLLPVFSLSKKGKKEGVEYRTEIERGEGKVEIIWRVLPGPLGGLGLFEKEVFRAVEYLLTKQGFPIKNPLAFSIFDLCKAMRLKSTGGRAYEDIKAALMKLTGAVVQSRKAFYSKKRRAWIDDTFHLYDQVTFVGEVLPDGRIADTNYLWLGRRYLESLNAFYIKPLDYEFYRSLRSPVAKRLYELLSVKFYGAYERGNPYVHYRYSNLCAILPIKRQLCLSRAREKLSPAHRELQERGFLAEVEWLPIGDSRDWVVRYFPGPRAEKEIEEIRQRKEWLLEEGEEHALQRAEDEAWIKGFATHMAEELEDEKNMAFYDKLARLALKDRALEDLIYCTLSEVKDIHHRGRIRKNKGAAFVDKLKRYCKEKGIELV